MFSYFLVRGLYGLADKNKDKQVTLMELTMYLQDKVTSNAQKSQIPKTDGSPKKVVSLVDDEMVKKLLSEPESQPLASAEVSTRGMGEKPIENAKEKVNALIKNYEESKSTPSVNEPEENYLDEANEIILNEFWYALDNGDYIDPEGQSAYDYYLQLVEYNYDPEELSIMGSELVWAMRDEIDYVINANLATEFFYEDDIDESLDMVDTFVEYIGSCIEILGPDHYMNDHLMAKGLYLSALGDALFSAIVEYNREYYIQESIDANLEALKYDDAAAYIYNDLGSAYAALDNNEKAIFYFKKAIDLSPTWQIALANLYGAYLDTEEFELADQVKEKVLRLESDNPWIYYTFGGAYYDAEMYKEALKMYDKAKDSYNRDNYLLYNAIGNCYWYGMNDPSNGEEYYRIALNISSDAYWPSYNLANVLYAQGKYPEAEEIILRIINKNKDNIYFYEMLGNIYAATNRLNDGFEAYQKVVELDPNYSSGHINMMYFFAITGQNETALEWMESGLQKGYNDENYFLTHQAYEYLRAYPKFQELLRTYIGN